MNEYRLFSISYKFLLFPNIKHFLKKEERFQGF